MTEKDIRDIAAYWGAPCQYIMYGHLTGFGVDDQTSKWPTHVGPDLFWVVQTDSKLENLKLHLRPMASLTDEEWNTGLSLLDAGENVTLTLRERNPHGMIDAGPLAIRFDGAVTTSYYISVTPLWAYLQSIGIYIPGTIDEKYVQLIP